MKYIKNNKGFTLVELLAVIVILALIMGIAVYSMQGVIGDVEISSMKSSAATYIEGVRKMLLLNMDISEGDYYISDALLEKKVSSPWGSYQYNTTNVTTKGYAKATGTLTCGTGGSFVRVTKVGNNYTYAICLYDDANNYIFASEDVLNDRKGVATDYYHSGDISGKTLSLDNGKIKVS